MDTGLIKKKLSDFKIPPNLDDYEKVRQSFSYQDAKKEIDFVGGKLKAAENTIERKTQNFRKKKATN